MSALFLSPHPDDVELFCGGTVAVLAGLTEVRIADLTRGEMSSNGTVETRAAEAEAARRALGLDADRIQLGLPDAGLDARDAGQLQAIVGLIREVRPDLLFAPWIEDRHPDHVAAGELARRAVALAAEAGYGAGGESFGPCRLLHYPCHSGVEPSILLDVSNTIEQWEAAVRSYPSQFLNDTGVSTPINQPGFVDHHRLRRSRWGQIRGVEFAEAFVHEGPWPVSPSGLQEL